MSLSIYEISIPQMARMLHHLSGILDKAAAHAAAAGRPGEALAAARLAPDMWSLTEQVKGATNFGVRLTARLAGLPIPTFEGRDDSLPSLKDRVLWAAAFLECVDPAAFEGSEARTVVFPTGDTEHRMSGLQYLLTFAQPNFYFHMTAAYCILRHQGVPLVKEDWLGAI
jgi:hypothetical protein